MTTHPCANALRHTALQVAGLGLWLWLGVRLVGALVHGLTGSGAASLLAMGLAFYPGIPLVWRLLAGACAGPHVPRRRRVVGHGTVAAVVLGRMTE
jgi:hypothetical protein